ncbi:MAG: hypothetical protein ACXV8O_01105 [Methylobacter sp.]
MTTLLQFCYKATELACRCQSTKTETIAVIYNKKTNMLGIIFLATNALRIDQSELRK